MEYPQHWLTVKETMNYLKVSRPTVYVYIKQLKLTTSKLIGKTLIEKGSIDKALIQKQQAIQ